jgi:crotonobetainyl-CoA:carnitine CoA-transferase CaiB-like acyl-CoA transferase
VAVTWPTSPANADRPLFGTKVLDLSRVLAGPYCTMLLADLGADVIKIEPPKGDETRRWGGPVLGDAAPYYFVANRNKWDVVLDLNEPEGQKVLDELILQADVLIHNYTGDLTHAFGVDYEAVLARNPEIIYLSVSAFGPEEPDRRGYDLVAQALGGIMAVTGAADGPPTKVGVPISDMSAGLFSAIAVLAGLVGRRTSQGGMRLDVSLYDATVALLSNQAMNWMLEGREGERLGNDHPSLCPYGVYAASDGMIVLAAGTDAQFRSLCDALEINELADDERFVGNAQRTGHRAELRTSIERALAGRTATAWSALLGVSGVPNALVRRVSEALEAPEALSVSEVVHPSYGLVRQVLNPIRVDGRYLASYMAPPTLDEHRLEILGDDESQE